MESDEKKLINGCVKKDKKAQRQLYELYKVSLFRICLRYAKDRPEAEDILQDGFVKIMADIHQYRGEGALGGWMRRVMVNTALQHIRKQNRQGYTVEITEIADTHQADEVILSDLRAKALTQLIQKLPPGYRAVFNMYVIEGFSHKEIAEQMEVTESTSKSQLSKAKAMLRKMLERNLVG
ncbi:MAG: RNA polymerase sigma factor [Saprospiraceae bacterium]|nr:RNA polymerase sigma factor [Saprospiraceae bacterium]MCB9324250.1 RNA polymerase sigma factor [Lewinellaceae bacterium]